MFGASVDASAKAHAVAQYPNEACGLVIAGEYVPLANVAEDPTRHFQLPANAPVDYEAVLHSHCAPAHVIAPSGADMAGQIETGVPWGIILTDGKDATAPLWWGDFRLDEPLLGQPYIWGANYCWTLVRKWFWQMRQIKLPDFAIDHVAFASGENLMEPHFAAAGLSAVAPGEARAGDIVFMRIRGSVPNHCGVLLEDGLFLHHLPERLSRREPIGPWRKHVTHWLRRD